MNSCPYCQTPERQVKDGKNASGSQRFKGQQCGRKYTPEPKEQGYPEAVRQQAVRLYLEGMNYSPIGRLLQVDHKTVMHWVNAHSDQLPSAPVPNDVNNAELDELFAFVGKKKTSSML